jgi:hypothetical protein
VWLAECFETKHNGDKFSFLPLVPRYNHPRNVLFFDLAAAAREASSNIIGGTYALGLWTTHCGSYGMSCISASLLAVFFAFRLPAQSSQISGFCCKPTAGQGCRTGYRGFVDISLLLQRCTRPPNECRRRPSANTAAIWQVLPSRGSRCAACWAIHGRHAS